MNRFGKAAVIGGAIFMGSLYASPDFAQKAMGLGVSAVALAKMANAGDTSTKVWSDFLGLSERIASGQTMLCPKARTPSICEREFAAYRERIERIASEGVDEALIAGDVDPAKEQQVVSRMRVSYRLGAREYDDLRRRHGP